MKYYCKYCNFRTIRIERLNDHLQINHKIFIKKNDQIIEKKHNLKKAFSFSLFGNNDKYCIGMVENVEIIKKKYIDWDIYIFFYNIPKNILEILKYYKCILIEYKEKMYDWEGLLWRFNLFNYKSIDIWISRDADSRISDREMSLVNDWIISPYPFHIIRDHQGHGITILAGLFGVKNYFFSNLDFKNLIDIYRKTYNYNNPRFKIGGIDQYFLDKHIWPLILKNHMAHISLNSLSKTPNDILIKPDKNNNFIGKVILNYTIDHEYIDYKINNNFFSDVMIYWINLERSKNRYDKINSILNKYNLKNKKIKAYDGKILDTYNNIDVKTKKTPYEIGCTLSHFESIKTAFNDNQQYALIMEDDIRFNHINKFKTNIDKIIKEAPNDWNIIKLHCIYKKHIKKLLRRSLQIGNYSLWEERSVGTGIYLINKNGMKKIIDKFYINNKWTIHKEKSHADFIIYNNVKTYDYTKPLFDHEVFESTIHNEYYNSHMNALKYINNFYN